MVPVTWTRNALAKLLAHPLTRGLDLDSPETTRLRKQIIEGKPFLHRIYQEWYKAIARDVPVGTGDVLELGSGAGFLKDYIPDLITSDVFPIPGVSMVVDAHRLPFQEDSLRAIVMANVVHHLVNPCQFLCEAARCLRPGGVVVMVEPWVSSWSRFVYSKLHHESFEPDSPNWTIPDTGPLSGANIALPWILFDRDRAQFEKAYPAWQIEKVEMSMPLLYLLSGGVSLRYQMPTFSFDFWLWLERRMNPWMGRLAMFAQVVLRKSN